MTSIILALRNSLRLAAGISLLAMMLLTVLDVVGRYGLGSAIFGAAEYIEFLMLVAVITGIGLATAENGHIRLELAGGETPRSGSAVRRWVLVLAVLIVSMGLAAQLADHAVDSFLSKRRTVVLELPLWIMPATASLLMAAGTLLFAFVIVRTRGRPEDLDRVLRTEAGAVPKRPRKAP